MLGDEAAGEVDDLGVVSKQVVEGAFVGVRRIHRRSLRGGVSP